MGQGSLNSYNDKSRRRFRIPCKSLRECEAALHRNTGAALHHSDFYRCVAFANCDQPFDGRLRLDCSCGPYGFGPFAPCGRHRAAGLSNRDQLGHPRPTSDLVDAIAPTVEDCGLVGRASFRIGLRRESVLGPERRQEREQRTLEVPQLSSVRASSFSVGLILFVHRSR